MVKNGKSGKVVGVLMMVVGLLIIISLFSGFFSIAQIINEKPGSSYASSVSEAFSRCNSDRADFAADGQVCDPCALTCASNAVSNGDGTYSWSYSSSSSIYEGSWDDLECDFVGSSKVSSFDTDYPDFYRAGGNILEVKSYCYDTIRVCNKPIGTPSLLTVTPVPGGEVRKYEYTYGFGPCDGSDTVTGSTSTEIKYRLVCDSDYYVDGDDFDSDLSDLGRCVAEQSGVPAEDEDFDVRAGVLSDLVIADEVVVGDQVSVRGKFVAEGDGVYLIGVETDDAPQGGVALSVVTGSATFDQCSNDLQSASNFFNLRAGDELVFSMIIQAPDVAGVYDVNVFATQGCSMVEVYDSQLVTMIVVDDFVEEESVIESTIVEEADDYSQFYDDLVEGAGDLLDEVADQGGCEGVDLSVDGCVIAECVDNEVVMLDDVQCFELDSEGNFDPEGDDFVLVDGTALQENIVDDNVRVVDRLLVFGHGGLGFAFVGGLLLFLSGLIVYLFVGKKNKK